MCLGARYWKGFEGRPMGMKQDIIDQGQDLALLLNRDSIPGGGSTVQLKAAWMCAISVGDLSKPMEAVVALPRVKGYSSLCP